MINVMLALGTYRFSIDTAAYQQFARESNYEWAENDRVGQAPSMQFTGRKGETISLDGIILPDFRGGYGQLNAMRAEADRGVQLPLISGTGDFLGNWAITSIREGQEIFWSNGVPRKMTFTIGLKRYVSVGSIFNGIKYADEVSGLIGQISQLV